MAQKPPSSDEKTKDKAKTKVSGGRIDSGRLRTSIQDAIDQAHEEHRREMLRRRVDLARQGVRNYQLKRMGDAVKAFHTYIRILEDWKGVPEGGLNPSLFEMPRDLPELLLINGVYWDLVKLYDRTQSEAKKKEFLHYMEKFIVFSKSLPFEPLAAETLRKYIRNEKPRHKEEFKTAYKMLAGNSCFVATALIDVTDEATLPRLRLLRDETLSRSSVGRAFIRWYYRAGPTLAKWTDRWPTGARSIMGRLLDEGARLAEARITRGRFRSGAGGTRTGCRRG